MPRSTLPRAIRALIISIVAVVAVLSSPAPASAHNTFQSSSPADGSVVDGPPAEISLVFAKAVPLDSASAEVIESSGVRTELSGLRHGPGGDIELIAPLPMLAPGEITVRWRLVGPDGHPLSGRVTFTISAELGVGAATPSPSSPSAASVPSVSGDPADPLEIAVGEDFSTPSVLRWLLRYGSYLAIMVVVGVVLTDAFVWAGCAARPRLRRMVDRSLLLIAGLAAVQSLVLASDISGEAPWNSFGALDAVARTDAGLAFILRGFIAGCLWLVVRRAEIRQPEVRWTAIGVAGAALMATWAFAGHSASQRWPDLGVPIDVAHHIAAATWLGSLSIVALLAAGVRTPDELIDIFRRLSRTAATAVTVVALTGIAQSLRLVGSPANLFDGTHGRLLTLKLIALAGMLAAADRNRRRVQALTSGDQAMPGVVTRVRRTIGIELVLGFLILAITSGLVVSSPASADDAAGAARRPAAAMYPGG